MGRSPELGAEPRSHFPSPSLGGSRETCYLPQGPQRRRVSWRGYLWPECPMMGEKTPTSPARSAPGCLTASELG